MRAYARTRLHIHMRGHQADALPLIHVEFTKKRLGIDIEKVPCNIFASLSSRLIHMIYGDKWSRCE